MSFRVLNKPIGFLFLFYKKIFIDDTYKAHLDLIANIPSAEGVFYTEKTILGSCEQSDLCDVMGKNLFILHEPVMCVATFLRRSDFPPTLESLTSQLVAWNDFTEKKFFDAFVSLEKRDDYCARGVGEIEEIARLKKIITKIEISNATADEKDFAPLNIRFLGVIDGLFDWLSLATNFSLPFCIEHDRDAMQISFEWKQKDFGHLLLVCDARSMMATLWRDGRFINQRLTFIDFIRYDRAYAVAKAIEFVEFCFANLDREQ